MRIEALRSARTLTRASAEDGIVIAIVGRLDLGTVPEVRERLLRASCGPGAALVLDLSGVGFCDALGLGMLVAVDRRARQRGGGMRLVAASDAVVEALRASGLNRILPVVPALPVLPFPEVGEAA
ncbi:STAS domain-containing protein [Streptomyces sp. NBC_01537]|uniref:STAS domain-containing protein n=1 Tax=Streptomyces sp. NBC_01537 TaxID=2903896 RepID=UPI00386CFE16